MNIIRAADYPAGLSTALRGGDHPDWPLGPAGHSAALRDRLRSVEVIDFIGALEHDMVDANLVTSHPSVGLHLSAGSRQYHLAHCVGEYRGPPSNLAEAVLVHPTARPGTKTMSPKTSFVERLEHMGRVRHKARWLLDRVPVVRLLAVHALVGADVLYSL